MAGDGRELAGDWQIGGEWSSGGGGLCSGSIPCCKGIVLATFPWFLRSFFKGTNDPFDKGTKCTVKRNNSGTKRPTRGTNAYTIGSSDLQQILQNQVASCGGNLI